LRAGAETACVATAQAHNTQVSESGNVFAREPGGCVWVFCLLAVALAGCATRPHEPGESVSDWEQEEVAATPAVPPAPVVVPSPEAAPVPPPIVVTDEPTQTWVPLGRWCLAKGLAAPNLLAVAMFPTYSLSTAKGVFVIRAGSDSARWDGLELRLGFPPQVIDGQPYMHTLDLSKTLEPLATGGSASLQGTNLTIVIDPGHGGNDSGAKCVLGYGYEKDFTLDWARRAGALLAEQGWQVFLTRTADVDMALSNRVAFAEAHQADLFLSLHFNSAAPSDREAGLETYCLTPTGMPSNLSRGYGDDPALAFPNNAFDAQNLQLALRVHRALLQVNGRLDRGVRRARFLGVLRGQNRPAVLVEGGYLSNPAEARRIADPAYRQRLAEGIALAVVETSEGRSAKSETGVPGPNDPNRRAELVSRKAGSQ